MKKLINRILELYHLPFTLRQNTQIVRNTFALTALEKLLSPGIFFPISTPSLELHSLLQVVNDIIINQKKTVVEIGPGLSTIVLCRLKKLNNLPFRFYAVESNAAWIDLIINLLKAEGLEEMVTLIHAPLEDCPLGYAADYQWYSLSALDRHFSGEQKIDLVLVDGPPAYQADIQFSRYPALPYFKNKLGPSFSFYLDDAARAGETEILKRWHKSVEIKPLYLSSSFAVLTKDLPFYPFIN